MIRASDLVGCVVRTESGKRIGRVHDLRARAIDGVWQLDGLIVGRSGMSRTYDRLRAGPTRARRPDPVARDHNSERRSNQDS